MDKHVYDDVNLKQCNVWFTNCWFNSPTLGVPVYIFSVNENSLFAIDCFSRNHILKVSDIDVKVPELGYVIKGYDELDLGREFVNESCIYLSPHHYRTYRKGLELQRIDATINKLSTGGERGFSWEKHKLSFLNKAITKKNLSKYAPFIYNVFNPKYYGINEFVRISKSLGNNYVKSHKAPLSKDLAVYKWSYLHKDYFRGLRSLPGFILLYKENIVGLLKYSLVDKQAHIRLGEKAQPLKELITEVITNDGTQINWA